MSTDKLIDLLVQAGISRDEIVAAMPDWWCEEAESSRAARMEVLFKFARTFNLSASALVRGVVVPLL